MNETVDGEELGGEELVEDVGTHLKSSVNIDGLEVTDRTEVLICGKDENTIITAFIS